MKKKLTLLVMAGVLSGVMLTGCVGTPAPGSATAAPAAPASDSAGATAESNAVPAAPAEKTKLTWWTYQRHDMAYMEAAIEKFNAENPYNIEIEYEVQSENFRNALDLSYQSNSSPDIFTGQDNAKYYVDKDQVVALDPYLTDDIKERYGNMLYIENDNAVDGTIYSLANTGVTYRLVANMDLLNKAGYTEPPKTLSEMVEIAKKITEQGAADKVYGFAINLKNTQTAIERSVKMIGMRSGFTYYDYNSGLYDFTPFEPIVDAFRQIVVDGSMFPGYESLDVDPMRAQFAEGKIGMYLSGSWEPGVYADQFKTDVNWVAAPVPVVDTVNGPVTLTGLKWLYISKQCENPDLAWKVLEYFYSDDICVPYAEGGYGNPVIPSVVAKVKEISMPGMDYFKPTSNDVMWPSMPQERTLEIEGKPFNDVFAQIIMGETTFADEIEELNRKYNDALTKAIAEGSCPDFKLPNFDPAALSN